MSARSFLSFACGLAVLVLALIAPSPISGQGQSGGPYQIYVSNERSADVTVIDGATFKPVGTFPIGKRPRGIHASLDGKMVYVAVSGTPPEDPPKLDAQGNPIFKKDDDDDDNKVAADKSADGIAVFDVAQKKLVKKINAGSDPEEFALSTDGTQFYVSNEDVKTASVINIASGKVEHIILVGQEPEGVGVSPDGKTFWITCEAGGDIFAIDASTYKPVAHFTVHLRPRSIDFLTSTGQAFIPSESVGELNIIDYKNPKLLKTVTLPQGSRPMHVKLSPSADKLYISNGRAGTISVVDPKTYNLLATIKVGARPWGFAISPDGKYLFSANGPSNDVSVVDLAQNKEIAKVKAGSSPWGIAVVPNAQ